MHPTLANDLARLPELLDSLSGTTAELLEGLGDRPVATSHRPEDVASLPLRGVGLDGALSHFQERWQPDMSASAGPRYLGFVTGGVTPAALAGDWLAAALDQNAASDEDSAATALERETTRWLAELFGLGDAHQGTFVTGATTSNFVGLAIAREWLGERSGASVAEDGAGVIGSAPVLSGAPHSSVAKSLAMLGLGRGRLQRIPCLPDREAVDVDALAAALAGLDGRPAIVVANAGTVNTADFDDLGAIAELCRRHGCWLHVDGAFGAFAALAPAHAHLLDGLDAADSICVDLHKWMNVPYDAAVQFTRHRELQLRVFRNSAAYLGEAVGDPHMLDLTPENSRRLRALAAWFALTAYGREGHREIVERDIAAARSLGELIAGDRLLRVLAPVRLNVVCFTLADDPTPERVAALVAAIAESGEAFLTPTVYDGTPALRAAFCNWRTTPADSERVFRALQAACRVL